MSSSTCSYCGSVLERAPLYTIDKPFCDYCEMFVEPSVNGQRIEHYKRLEAVEKEHMNLKTSDLLTLHNCTLLRLLRLMRKEVWNCDPMSEQEYVTIARKCFVVESILKKRMAYIPRTITDKLIESFDERCDDPYNNKPMTIVYPQLKGEQKHA